MAKKKEITPKNKRLVTINLDALRKAVEELAPGYGHIAHMERLIRGGDYFEGGIEKRLVLNMSLHMHTVLGKPEANRIKTDLTRLAAFMDILEAVAAGGALDKVAPTHISELAEEAKEKLYDIKALLTVGHKQARKEAGHGQAEGDL